MLSVLHVFRPLPPPPPWQNNLLFLFFSFRGLCAIYRSRAGRNPESGAESEHHNGHWLPGSGGPSDYMGYYDAASLYPSSSE